jgi:serine/threonine protein kinase
MVTVAEPFNSLSGKTEVKPRKLTKGVGTLIYQAPEMMAGINIVDSFTFQRTGKTGYAIDKADVFSFAILMYEVVTQKEPFAEPPFDKFGDRGRSNWLIKVKLIADIVKFVISGQRLPIPSTIAKQTTHNSNQPALMSL